MVLLRTLQKMLHSDLEVGDDVFGHLQYASSTRQGTLAEYITISASGCAKIPEGIKSEEAAAVTPEALTALQGMRDQGKLSTGKSILVIAVWGVGTQAVQVAKARKAGTVHAVCSAKDVVRAATLGADLVIDRTEQDITKDLKSASYDVIFDTTAGKHSYLKMRYALKKGGTFVSTVPNITVCPPFSWIASITGKRSKSLLVNCNRADLELVGEWMKSGEIHSVPIDTTYDVKDIHDAREREESGAKAGRVVIKVAGGW